MASERTKRQIDRLLDEAEEAVERRDWAMALERSQDVLIFDPAHDDGHAFFEAAQRALGMSPEPLQTLQPPASPVLDSAGEIWFNGAHEVEPKGLNRVHQVTWE